MKTKKELRKLVKPKDGKKNSTTSKTVLKSFEKATESQKKCMIKRVSFTSTT
jgi:hypothetical protein